MSYMWRYSVSAMRWIKAELKEIRIIMRLLWRLAILPFVLAFPFIIFALLDKYIGLVNIIESLAALPLSVQIPMGIVLMALALYGFIESFKW